MKEATPVVSVIVPTYNRKQFLPRTIESVLAQTFEDFELIIADDGSTDGTREEIAARYTDPRIRYEYLQQNGGVHVARNHGLSQARGEYVVFLDSDDELLPHALERAVSSMPDQSFGILSAPLRLDSGLLSGFSRSRDSEIPFLESLCEVGVHARKAGFTLLRRSVIGPDRFVGKNLDFIFFRRIESRTRIYFVAEPLALYHENADAISMTQIRKLPNPQLSISRAQAIAGFLDQFGDTMIEHCPLHYSYYAYGATVGLILGGEMARARAFAGSAYRAQPRVKYFALRLFAAMPFASPTLWLLFTIKAYSIRTWNKA